MNRARSAKKKAASRARKERRRHKRMQADRYKTQARTAMNCLLKERIFQSIAFHGNTSWLPWELIFLTLFWIWAEPANLTDAFTDARIQAEKLFGKAALTTYQGMAGALETWTPVFMPLLQKRLHELMQEIGGRFFRVGPWVPLAIDGSRVGTPRTESNETAFCAKNYGNGKTAKYRKKKTKGMRRTKNEKAKPQPQRPQIWVTMIWHIPLGLAWCWKLGPSDSSERGHVMDMLKTAHFPPNTLFVGDAGFVGYDFWTAIVDTHRDFLARVGGNVRLLTELDFYVEAKKKTRKKTQLIYCWPNAAMRKKTPPLVLRLIKCRIGKKNVYLLTSVLDEQKLSNQLAIKLYKLRWGIELEFRALKQTFTRRNLRSRKSQRALVEMEWSILGMAIIELFALREQLKAKGADPSRCSFANSLRAVRETLKNLSEPPDHLDDLHDRLAWALVDDYERTRSKEARYKPNKKPKPACGKPVIKRASAKHRERLKQIQDELQNAA